MSDTRFEHHLRVRYAETDAGGVAHHSSYVAWIEEARTEWMRARGTAYRDVEAAGHYLMVTDMRLQYRSPLRYDDEVRIEVFELGRRRVALEIGYEVFRVGDGRHIATAQTTLCCADREGKVRRLPDGV